MELFFMEQKKLGPQYTLPWNYRPHAIFFFWKSDIPIVSRNIRFFRREAGGQLWNSWKSQSSEKSLDKRAQQISASISKQNCQPTTSMCVMKTLWVMCKKISYLGWETRRKSWTTIMNEFWDLLKVKDLIDIVFALSLTFQRSNSFNPTVFQCSKTARGFSDEEKHLNFFFAEVQTQQRAKIESRQS